MDLDYSHWQLMHKDIVVADVEIFTERGLITKILKVYNIAHAPMATRDKTNSEKINRKELQNWFSGRTIPASRQNLDDLFFQLSVYNANHLALKSFALSLSDHYWFKPMGESVSWHDVNFFQNDFTEDIGKILFRHKDATDPHIDFHSPDNTSDGWLKKRWTIQDGKRVLLKGGSGFYAQETYNEEIASRLFAKLGIPHVNYTQRFINHQSYSFCEDFIDEETELITAFAIYNSKKKPNHLSNYDHLIHCCHALGMENITFAIDQMIVADYIIANTDRHWNNFGFVRNANTLQWLGFAPLYDNGTSLWHDKLEPSSHIKSKTFKNTLHEQLSLITDLSWFNPIPHEEIKAIITTILQRNKEMEPKRIERIATAVCSQVDTITALEKELKRKNRDSARSDIVVKSHGSDGGL